MSYVYEIDPKRRLALVTVTGPMTGRTLIDIVHALAADAAWSPSYSRIMDGRAVTEFVITPDEQQTFLDEVTTDAKRARKTAVVVASEARMLAVNVTRAQLRNAYPVRAFCSMEEALAWVQAV